MNVAVVPIKRLDMAKSRLAPYLPRSEREALVLRLASRAVTAIRESGLVETVAVVTPDPATAAALGTEHLPDTDGLNPSLKLAASWALDLAAAGLLILPCDLPMVASSDVETMLSQGPGVTIAATHDGGTGALYVAPPLSIHPQFGEGSFLRHLLAARKQSVPVHEVESDGLRYDLDTVDDLRRFGDLLRAG
jgi:2-phospho-L-lactate guanylyltransferase